jgi:O-antigen ligase
MDSGAEYWLAVTVYLVGSCITLWLWRQVVRPLPHPFGGVAWLVVFSLLFAPTVTEGDNGQIAPAVFGLLFGVISKNKELILSSLLPILLVLGLGFLVGFLVQRLRMQRV